jgi:hypothetical protein
VNEPACKNGKSAKYSNQNTDFGLGQLSSSVAWHYISYPPYPLEKNPSAQKEIFMQKVRQLSRKSLDIPLEKSCVLKGTLFLCPVFGGFSPAEQDRAEKLDQFLSAKRGAGL